MTDTIFITGVVIHARHGVMEHETEVGQRFVIDLELSVDLSESSHTDRLADTVSYSNVVATATAAFKNTNYKLLERAAGAVADAILAAFPRTSAVKITVHKPHAPIAAIFEDVGVVPIRAQQSPQMLRDGWIALGGMPRDSVGAALERPSQHLRRGADGLCQRGQRTTPRRPMNEGPGSLLMPNQKSKPTLILAVSLRTGSGRN
jgi:dihydroneopterin aldolase